MMKTSALPPVPSLQMDRSAIKRREKLNESRRHVNRLSLGMMVFTLGSLFVLSILYNQNDSRAVTNRILNEQQEDYSSSSCIYLFETVPTPGAAQCAFARTCNGGTGIWAPFVFCHSTSYVTLTALLTPVILLWMALLFRMLGSTAEDFFSPALEMLSNKLGLPPRFAGVSLLALGNGAADVSATVSAITSDVAKGYELSLGALSGAAMFISVVISALVVLAADGVPCRGALVRDVSMLGITVLVVWNHLRVGHVGQNTTQLFVTLYGSFVVLVLAADVYHRAVVVPRLRDMEREEERQRQWHAQVQQESTLQITPSDTEDNHSVLSTHTTRRNRFSNAITALSNYDNADIPTTGWGVEGDDLARDRPVVLRGRETSTTTEDSTGSNGATYSALIDTVNTTTCVEPGSMGVPALDWSDAVSTGRAELCDHARAVWDDIVWNADINQLTKFLLLCELPFTTLRKCTVPIPCDGHYVRALVALALVLSPPWLVYYLGHSGLYDVWSHVPWYWLLLIMSSFAAAALAVLRLAPGGDGSMTLAVATPIALYGFLIASTWIDMIASALVQLLNFVGIVLRIPGPIVGLTILAWGNSMGDLSADVTMARKGLGNMAMTACFAGPVFNVLVGLGLGFGALEAKMGQSKDDVVVGSSVVTGFGFLLVNVVFILVVGLVLGDRRSDGARIGKGYGYGALGLYVVYVLTAITVQFSKA